jgi:hypothetical protein
MKQRILLPIVVVGLVAAGVIIAAVVTSSSATTSAGGTALRPGQTVKLATSVTLSPRTSHTFGPWNTHRCGRLGIYADATDPAALYVVPLEASLPGQVNPITLPTSTTSNGYSQVVPTPSLEVKLVNHSSTSASTVSNIYVYCQTSR